MMTLEQRIEHFAQTTPDKTAVICGSETTSYLELWTAIQRKAAAFLQQGIKSKAHVFVAEQSSSFIETYCAIHLAGGIAVPLEHSVPDETLQRIRAQVDANVFAPETMDILFTTGTTGTSKGVMFSYRSSEAVTDNTVFHLGFHDQLLFIVSGPLNHIASLFKMHSTLSSGGTLCVIDGLRDLNAFFDIFNLPYQHFATFLVPASLRMFMQFEPERFAALTGKLDFIETGAAPISSADMRRLAEMLPQTRLYNTYGGTEIGNSCTYQFNDGRYYEGCVGIPMRNSTIELSEDGGIIVGGDTLMMGYVNDPEMTAQIMPDGRIHTSDVGYLDDEGMLHITGRRGDIINVGGFKVDPTEVEGAALAHPSVSDCICVPFRHPVLGTVLKLLYVSEQDIKTDLAQHLISRLERYKVPHFYEKVDIVARTYNGKLNRKFYTQPS